jgi:hypothetical protein
MTREMELIEKFGSVRLTCKITLRNVNLSRMKLASHILERNYRRPEAEFKFNGSIDANQSN